MQPLVLLLNESLLCKLLKVEFNQIITSQILRIVFEFEHFIMPDFILCFSPPQARVAPLGHRLQSVFSDES